MTTARDIIAATLTTHRHTELITCACGWAPSIRTIADLAGHQAAAVADALRSAGLPIDPGTWSLPAEPGPEVTAVRDAHGVRWLLVYAPPVGAWAPENDPMTAHPAPWLRLLTERGPLTDATGDTKPWRG